MVFGRGFDLALHKAGLRFVYARLFWSNGVVEERSNGIAKNCNELRNNRPDICFLSKTPVLQHSESFMPKIEDYR